MLKIRLTRVGRKNDPSFRVILTESTKGPKSGKYIEALGSYNPIQSTVTLNGERIKYWVSQGAQVSGTVHNLLIQHKVIDGKKINVLPRKSPIKKDLPAEASAQAGGEVAAAALEVASTPAEAAPEAPAPAEAAPADMPADLPAEDSAQAGASAQAGDPVQAEASPAEKQE
ncbi:30S ribosomal protein S16 [Candidatus Kaiserbacteria bacterium RIFCSPHIGHO2_02_FULL_49_11]|uniref:Small ribosomal subunit protein bS16 n=1 Tax=Candidatus Kaiserbacteria bacterium RIFCSPHIGHO2_02_FULL_49_11 TaxID=1798489 RepID=A0A1F6D191_9BACT|nr:MAG: 30S ribosomal protein S16 [Candidatus Kaiserbacteria bacterium RIFCSPHIGHO2_02_FULL_49_11]